MSIDKKTKKTIIWIILLVGLVLVVALNIVSVLNGISWVLGILYPFFLGCAIAYVLNIPMSFFERVIFGNSRTKDSKFSLKMKRPLSLLLAALIILAIIALVLFFFIPKLTSTITNLTDTINAAIPVWVQWASRKFAKYPSVIDWINTNIPQQIDLGKVLDQIIAFFASGADTGFNRILRLATTVINKAVNIGIGIAVACYLCASKEKHKKRVMRLLYATVPEKGVKKFLEVCSLANETFHKFITGQCFEAVCLGVLVGCVMWVAGMPYAFFIAIICAICCFIPIFGAVIAGVCGGIVVLTANTSYLIAFLIIYILIRVFDDNFMYPHIIGKSIGMPAVFVLFAITVGGVLFGFGGMLFFIPLTSFAYKLIRRGTGYRLLKKKMAVMPDGSAVHLSSAAEAAQTEKSAAGGIPDGDDDDEDEDINLSNLDEDEDGNDPEGARKE